MVINSNFNFDELLKIILLRRYSFSAAIICLLTFILHKHSHFFEANIFLYSFIFSIFFFIVFIVSLTADTINAYKHHLQRYLNNFSIRKKVREINDLKLDEQIFLCGLSDICADGRYFGVSLDTEEFLHKMDIIASLKEQGFLKRTTLRSAQWYIEVHDDYQTPLVVFQEKESAEKRSLRNQSACVE